MKEFNLEQALGYLQSKRWSLAYLRHIIDLKVKDESIKCNKPLDKKVLKCFKNMI